MSFIQDRINEPDETFSMRLDSNSDVLLPTGTGVFYRQLIQCTIIDGDGKACPLLNIVRQIFLRVVFLQRTFLFNAMLKCSS